MRTLLPLVVLGLALTGCDDTVFSNGHGGSSGSDLGGGDSAAPLEGWCAVQSVINSQCVACHQGDGAAGGLDLATDPHGALVGQESSLYAPAVLVVAGEPDSSLLLAKITGTQAADQGGVMPPTGAVSSDVAEAVRQWIADGASDECENPDTGAAGTYHPEGFADPSVHPLEAKLHEQTCTDCHGEDLDGGAAGVSCDTCHTPEEPEAWRTDCTFCHGGVENSTGAPPEEIDDGTVDLAFGAHSRHVTENTHAAFDCTTCHDKPTDVLSPGHMFDSTPAVAEVDLSGGLSSAGTWDSGAMACSNLYCHGNGRSNGSVAVADAPLSCDSCHPDQGSGEARWDTMSGEHDDHLADKGLVCQDCHSETTDESQRIIAPGKHVDGRVQFAPDSGTVVFSAGECTGTCHGGAHDRDDWN